LLLMMMMMMEVIGTVQSIVLQIKPWLCVDSLAISGPSAGSGMW